MEINPENPKWQQVLTSRKFWAAVIALVLLIANSWVSGDWNTEALSQAIVAVFIAYIASVAYEDGEFFKSIGRLMDRDSE